MPIPAQDIAGRIRAALDAENSDHYRDDLDIIPAINAAQDWLVTIINSVFGNKKFGEEILCDLTQADVFQTTEDSRVSLNVFPETPWTILAVYPKPTTKSNLTPVATVQTNAKISIHKEELYHVSSDNSAKRLTIEEWATNKSNPFEPGYDGDQLCDELKEYAYLDPFDYQSYPVVPGTGMPNLLNPLQQKEIEIRPALVNELVTIFYAKEPTKITALNQNVLFPVSALSLLTQRALGYISYKQGDGTNLYAVTQLDINNLLQSIN